MKIHIGKLIEEVAKGVKIANMDKFCSDKLNMTTQNYYRILKQENINTDILLKFCSAFSHDFFQYYYTVEPLRSIRNKEIEKLKEENSDLITALERKEDILKDFERKIKIQKEEIDLLKDKQAAKRPRK